MANAEKLTESTLCPLCGVEVEPTSSAGRPKVYCSDVCRRAGEYRLRSLARRIDKVEVELRELTFGSSWVDGDERKRRMRLLKAWLAADNAELHKLLGQNNQKESNGAR